MRLDRALVERGLARSRGQAQELIAAGRVRHNGRTARRPADAVAVGDELTATADPYVSRAAHKLLGALDDLDLHPRGRALDAGSSTGGFTQVLLERGCSEVVAVDVGTDQLVPQLRADPRVRVHEQTNLRDLALEHVDGRPVDLVVADVSFISLTLLIGPLTSVVATSGSMLLMVKPQFEVGRDRLAAGGVVRDPGLWRDAVAAVVDAAAGLGWYARRGAPSRVLGPAGNQEFFVHFDTGTAGPDLDVAALAASAAGTG